MAGLHSDLGYRHIKLAADGSKHTLQSSGMIDGEAALRLNFCGKVSRIAKEGSLPLCQAFQQEFYLEGCAHARPNTTEVLLCFMLSLSAQLSNALQL